MSPSPVDAYDVAIILGAALRDDGSASPAMERRVAHGVELLRRGRAGALLMTGGATTTAVPEARVMRELAVAKGADAARVVVEGRALNTIQNALFCRPLLRRHNWRRVVVITDSFHVPRAAYIFRRFGLRGRVEGVLPAHRSAQWWLAHLREAAALPWTMIRVEAFRLRRRGVWYD